MKNLDRSLFLHALILGAGAMVLIAGSSAEAATSDSQLMKQAIKSSSEKISAAEKILEEAKKLRQEQKYEQAEVALTKILAKVSSKNAFMKGELAKKLNADLLAELKLLREEWASRLMRLARIAANEERYSDAILLAADASVKDPLLNAEARVFTEACNNAQRANEFKNETSIESSADNFKSGQKLIDKLKREGNTLFANGKYNDARIRYERVFLINPYDTDAIEALSKVYSKLYQAGSRRREADVQGMLDNNAWDWSEPIWAAEMSDNTPRNIERKELSSDSIYSRMDKIIIPEFTFTNFNIQKVVGKLNEMSKVADPDKRGVNIALGLDADTAKNLNVTMNFLQIPLSDLIRYLCMETGLKYRIEGDGIFIGTSDADMHDQIFEIRGDLMDVMTGSTDDKSAAKSDKASTLGKIGEGRDFTEEDTASTYSVIGDVDTEALKSYFGKRGISFGEGAKIAYDRRVGRLFVTNTMENLRRLDELIRQLDAIKTPLVLVEIKLVEITENDWQELGFQWKFDMQSSETIANDGTRSEWAMTQGSDPIRQSDLTYKLVNDLKILPNFGNGLIKGVDMNLALSIDAISRNDRTDVLSAPKLLTTKGSTASIELTTRYYFPSEWEAPEIESDDNGLSFSAPTPEWDEATDIGILLSITPDVDPDNYTISMELHPEVVSYIGRSEDNKLLVRKTINRGTDTKVVDVYYNIWMPVIARRKADVFAKVYDGETIIIGGMVDNSTDMIRDKWPILGDLPLVGRLFSGEKNVTVRRNLVIFVTARLVNNDGVPIRQGLNRGIPDFNR